MAKVPNPLQRLVSSIRTLPCTAYTRGLMVHLMLDLPLTQIEMMEFGVRHEGHTEVLKRVLDRMLQKMDLTAVATQMEQARGSGAAVTALARTYTPEFPKVRFRTVWDDVSRPTADKPKPPGR